MCNTRHKLQKNYDNVVKNYNLIDKKSTYTIEYRYIEKDFVCRLLSLYIKLKILFSNISLN